MMLDRPGQSPVQDAGPHLGHRTGPYSSNRFGEFRNPGTVLRRDKNALMLRQEIELTGKFASKCVLVPPLKTIPFVDGDHN